MAWHRESALYGRRRGEHTKIVEDLGMATGISFPGLILARIQEVEDDADMQAPPVSETGARGRAVSDREEGRERAGAFGPRAGWRVGLRHVEG